MYNLMVYSELTGGPDGNEAEWRMGGIRKGSLSLSLIWPRKDMDSTEPRVASI